ncbi:MAG: hypothetical protein ABL932_17625, partial [Terricaulis sp.]
MHLSRYAASAFAAAALLSTPAYAQDADAIASLRRDMETLRQDYEARVNDLEARLAQAEADASAARQSAEQAQQNATQQAVVDTDSTDQTAPDTVDQYAGVASEPAGGAAANANAFNPGISVVLNGFLTASDRDTGGERIAGVATGGEIENPPPGVSLGEAEIALSANIDPYFYGFMVAAIDSAGEIGIEEASISTTQLPAG